jgi:hypothetical protein
VEQIIKRVKLGREAAIKVQDPVLRQRILDVCQDLEDCIAPLVKAIKAVYENPDDPEAQRNLDAIIEKVNELSELLASLLPHDQNLMTNGNALEAILSKLLGCLKEENLAKR